MCKSDNIHLNRFWLGFLIFIILGFIFGFIIYSKFIFIDLGAYSRDIECNISCYNITENICHENNRDRTRFFCYYANINLNATIDNTNYTKWVRRAYAESVHICDGNNTTCHYDYRYIEDTLDVLPVDISGWVFMMLILWIIIEIPILILLIIMLVTLIKEYKLKSEYVPIEDDKEISLRIN